MLCMGHRLPEVHLGSLPTQVPLPFLPRQVGGSCAGTCQSLCIKQAAGILLLLGILLRQRGWGAVTD